MKFLGILLLLLLIALAVAAGVIYLPYGPSTETFVDIAPGTGTETIAAQLERSGVIRSRYAFYLLRLKMRGTLKAGEYRFDGQLPMTDVYQRILHGDVYTRAFTIPEGFNIFDIAQAAEAAGFGPRDTFLAAERQHTELIAAWTTDGPPPSLSKAIFFPTPISSHATPPRSRSSPPWCAAFTRRPPN
ncbi:endolytic transglycosylase MltG [Tunturiibacter gelidiferens]